MFKTSLVLSCVMFVVYADVCPPRDKLLCSTRPREAECRVTTYTMIGDTKCPMCEKCIMKDANTIGESGCPPVACPMWDLAPDCRPTFFSMKLDFGDVKGCRACDVPMCSN